MSGMDKVVILSDIRDLNLKIDEELDWLRKMLDKAETRASIALREAEGIRTAIDIIEGQRNK